MDCPGKPTNVAGAPAGGNVGPSRSAAPPISQAPPKPVQMDEMLFGPRSEFPDLSNTWKPSLTIWTYCVWPIAPLVSGGAQLQPTPGYGMPSKLVSGPGTFGLRKPR